MPDPDLPADAAFVPLPPVVTIVGQDGSLAQAMTISPITQAALHHNLARYDELSRLRRGQSNRYLDTSYR
jgi:hypothetical protein